MDITVIVWAGTIWVSVWAARIFVARKVDKEAAQRRARRVT